MTRPSERGRRWTLGEIAEHLRRAGIDSTVRPPADAWGLILWENCAYLATDSRRAAAFATLERTIGLAPAAIRRSPDPALRAVGRYGTLPESSARKLRECAELMLQRVGDDVTRIDRLPTSDLREFLLQFPGVGAPLADRILVSIGRTRTLPMDSNALRVLLRFGCGVPGQDYRASYVSVLEDLGAPSEAPSSLMDLSRRLTALGRTTCRRKEPNCGGCPLRPNCRVGRGAH